LRGLRRNSFLGRPTDQFASAALALDLGTGRGAESVRAHGQLLSKFTVTQDFDPVTAAISQAGFPQGRGIDPRAVIEAVQRFQVHRDITGAMAGIVETSFWNTSDEWHLTAFEADPDGTAGAGGLAFAATAAGLAVPTGFTLAKTLSAMLCAGTGSKIV
jgi:hypothetical protein